MRKGSILHLFILTLLFCCVISPCPSSQYQVNGACYSCHVTCKTCTSYTTTSCLTCDQTRFLTTFNSCQCNDGSVQKSPVVSQCQSLSCHYSCVTCNNTATTCTSCSSAKNRIYVSGSNTCPCVVQYYDSGSSQCSPCHYSCTTCSGSGNNECLTCDAPTAHRVLANTSCPCIDKYFDVSNSYVCSACNYKCIKCVDQASNCSVCGANRASIPACLCSVGYYDDAVSTACISCQYSCKDCLNGTSCSACDASKFRISTSLSPFCSCMVRYYDYGAELCLPCAATCLTCLGPTQCLTCNTTANRIYQSSDKSCICMNGYYPTSTSVQLCSICDSRCLACSVTTSNCTSCDSTTNRVFTNNSCPCKGSFYQNTYIMCASCHIYCHTCTNGSQCVDCIPSTLMTLNSSKLCSCPAGTFYNSTSSMCQNCHYSCATCQSTSPVLCLTCPPSSFRTYSLNACPCDLYNYNSGINPICQKCHYSCRSCSAGTLSTCLSCADAAHRYLYGTTCLCKALFYDNGSLQLCQPCLYNCLTCIDATSCSSCNSTLLRVLDTLTYPNTCICMNYHFQKNQLCDKCLYSCHTCSSNSTCLSCNSSSDFRVLNGSTLLCDCLTGYYDNFVDRACLACLPQCLTCTNATACTSCDPSKNRNLTATSRCPCKNHYFDASGVCTGCLYYCSTCSSQSTCTTCNSTAFRKLSTTSQCICNDNYYDDGSNQLCLACSYACLTCMTSATQCVTCDTSQRSFSFGWCACAQRYYDNNLTVACVGCHHSCDSCLGSVKCQSCNSTRQRVFDNINQYCICSPGYYDDGMNEECGVCNYKCLTCTNSTQCLTCSSAWFRAIPASMCPCADGYYDDGSNHTCQPCHYSCKTCTNSSQCLSCDLSTNYRALGSNFLCKCIDRFYDDTLNNQLCQSCVYSCLTCIINSANCTTCNSTAKRQISSQSCVCAQRWYDNLVQLCLKCHYRCSTCVEANKCSSCNSTIGRIADSSNNLCKCDVMYWDDGQNETCKRCEQSCYTCTDMTQCLSCNITRNRLLNNTVDFFGVSSPYCVCLYRHYSPSPAQDCQPCHYSCQVCTGGTRDKCELCTPSSLRTLNTSTHQCLCPDGYYDDNLAEPCQLCHSYCELCLTGLPNSCSKCHNAYYLLSSLTSCYLTCPNYYYDYQVNFTCLACSQYCLKCVNSTYCSNCQTGKLLYNSSCVLQCPVSTYPHSSGSICLDCPKGCYNCSGNSYCSSCFQKFYYNSTLGFCFSCNSVCLNCSGPGQTDCTACQSPLIVYRGTCTVLECPVGSYVQPTSGCQLCSNKFIGATLCNYSQPSKCGSNYIFNGSACLSCNQVAGYQLKRNGQCGQICGDGLLIYLQCDDGNTIDGDGCSGKCTIEAGWICSYTSGVGSVCDLIQLPQMKLVNVDKKFGVNHVVVILALSRPILVVTSRFGLIISGLLQSQYNYDVKQISTNLSIITIAINYTSSLQDQNMTVSYSSARRLQLKSENGLGEVQRYINHQNKQHKAQSLFIEQQIDEKVHRLDQLGRLLTSISFTSTFSVSSYPPADYYPSSTLDMFNNLRGYINALSISIVVICFILAPYKMHLHAVTLIYIPAQIYISYGLLPASYTDWLQYTLQQTSTAALFGGYSLGQCCVSLNSDHSLTTSLTLNSGIVLAILLFSWLLLLFLTYFNSNCYNIEGKFRVIRYFIFSLHLLTLFGVAYSSMNTLTFYELRKNADVVNSVLGIGMTLFYMVALVALWVRTYNMVPKKTQSQRSGKIFNSKKDKEDDFIVPVPMMSQGSSDFKEIRQIRQKDRIQLQYESEKQRIESELQTKVRNDKSSSEKETIQHAIENAQEEPLIHDYFDMYNHYNMESVPTKAKYFLPLLLTKIYITAIFSSFLTNHPLPYMFFSSALQLIFVFFLIAVYPFHSTFTNLRLVITSLIFIAINIICGIYVRESMNKNYIFLFEEIAVYLVLSLMGITVIFGVIEHVLAWRRQLWKKIFEPCLKGSRLMGTKNIPAVDMFEEAENDHMERSSFKMTSSFGSTRRLEDSMEMDAFYARILKKENLKQRYKRERMMK